MLTRRPSLMSLAALGLLVALPFVYVFSYAPVVRVGQVTCGDSNVYRPVDWMIDNTPLRDPLMSWAQFCGVQLEFSNAEIRGVIDRSV
mgnify:FL=1